MTTTPTAEETEGAGRAEPGKRTWSAARRAAQASGGRRRRRDDATDGVRPDVEVIAEEAVEEAVANITTLAGFAMPIAPYTAVTIAGVPGPREGEWIVAPRARMAGAVLLEHAKRNPRVLAAIARFNLMFRNVEIVNVVGSVVAAAAVDAKVIPPDATIALPGGAEFPILYPAIADTIEYIAAQQEATPAEGTVRAERQARPDVTTPDVSEPEQPWSGELTPEQQAEAEATRQRIAARDRAREEAIRNGTEPTLRREGQVIVPGDVTKT